MANLFSNIAVPTSNGAGAAVDISTFGWIKGIVISGAFVGAITIEISNDGTSWAPLVTFYLSDEVVNVPFAANWVRARMSGYISGSPIASIGSNDLGTTITAVPVPAGNGVGAPVNVSALGQRKTITYSGGVGVDVNVVVEISEDGATFSQLASFNGPTPAFVNLDASVQTVRTRTTGFVAGTPTVALAAVADGGGGGATGTLQDSYDAYAAAPALIQLDTTRDGIIIRDAPVGDTESIFVVQTATSQDLFRVRRVAASSEVHIGIGGNASDNLFLDFLNIGAVTATIRTLDQTADSGVVATDLSITAGRGSNGGVSAATGGGDLRVTAGAGGTGTAGAVSGAGGFISLTAGDAGADGGFGGNAGGLLDFIAGDATVAGLGGAIRLLAGDSPSGTAGTITLTGGATTAGTAGAITITGGATAAAARGANVVLSGGIGGTSLRGFVDVLSADNVTNAVTDVLRVRHEPIAAGAASIGAAVVWMNFGTTSVSVISGRLASVLTTATAGAEVGQFEWSVISAGTVVRTWTMSPSVSAPVTTSTVDIGTSSLGVRTMYEHFEDATTATTIDIHNIKRTTSGTAANNMGAAILYQLEDSAGNTDDAIRLTASWVDVTSASEDSQFIVQARTAGAALGNVFITSGTNTQCVAGTFIVGANSVTLSTTGTVAAWTLANSRFTYSWTTPNAAADTTAHFRFIAGTRATTSTAGTEIISVEYDIDQDQGHATGALATQRHIVVRQPSNSFAGASTITTAVTIDYVGAPVSGTNATVTNAILMRIGGDVALGPTTAGMNYRVMHFPSHTATVTGTTTVTTTTNPFCMAYFGIMSITDGSAVTIARASTVYIEGAPLQAGSVTLTQSLALHIASGGVRFDGATFGIFGATPAVQQTSGANLTNNVTAGGTDNQIDNYTDLTTYATDAAAIRNNIYQLARKLKQINDGLRTLGYFT